MDYSHLITIEPDKRSGQPCIRGLRISVADVLGYLAAGMSADEILSDFPDLTADDIRACISFASDPEQQLAAGDAAESLRRMKEPDGTNLAQLKKKLGL